MICDPAYALLPRARNLPRQRAPFHARRGRAARRALAEAGLRRPGRVAQGRRERLSLPDHAARVRRGGGPQNLQRGGGWGGGAGPKTPPPAWARFPEISPP